MPAERSSDCGANVTPTLLRSTPWAHWLAAIGLTTLGARAISGTPELWQLVLAVGLIFVAGLAWVRVALGDSPSESPADKATCVGAYTSIAPARQAETEVNRRPKTIVVVPRAHGACGANLEIDAEAVGALSVHAFPCPQCAGQLHQQLPGRFLEVRLAVAPRTRKEIARLAARMTKSDRWKVFLACPEHKSRELPMTSTGEHYCPHCCTLWTAEGRILNAPERPWDRGDE